MLDIWGFLLQTLTASGVAVLLLVLKRLFRDKLPPKWHFALWGVLGIVLLIPAGWNGRYTVIQWQFLIELLKNKVREFSFTEVLFPIPFLNHLPRTLTDWIFVAYFAGVILHISNYVFAYIRLRRILRKGKAASGEIIIKVNALAADLKVKTCPVIEVPGLSGAFVCGVFRPVLAVPAGETVDDKVLLHELMHLKSRDTLWSVVICLLRSIHWCNPLMVYCANCATNDMECRCDQFVLERLEGEERRDYGYILLSMVNERFAKTPGSTCVNNGGKHIRKRIEAIARFKRYPEGMQLVSVCILLLLTLSLVIGVQASQIPEGNPSKNITFASARSVPCTTYAGAFDTYAKAVLEQNGYYRVMCAPYAMQEQLFQELVETKDGVYPEWDSGIPAWPNGQEGYYVYNLNQPEKNVYEGTMVIKLNYPPDGQAEEFDRMYLAIQTVRVEKENGRWVAIPLEDFQTVDSLEQSLRWGCIELPGTLYQGTVGKYQLQVKVQTVYTVESTKKTENDNFLFGNYTFYDTTPQPHATFTSAARTQSERLIHLGTEAERMYISLLGISVAPVFPGEERPQELTPIVGNTIGGGGSNTGESWGSQKVDKGWAEKGGLPIVDFGGGGGGTVDPKQEVVLPEYYAADLYLNGKLAASLDLYPQEG